MFPEVGLVLISKEWFGVGGDETVCTVFHIYPECSVIIVQLIIDKKHT